MKNKWVFKKSIENQYPYNTLGFTWFRFRSEVTRLQKQDGITQNPVTYIVIKLHWFTRLLHLSWRKSIE